MMGAFFWSALKHECCAQPSDTVQEEENVEGAGIFPEDEVVPGLEEDNTAGSHPELEDASPALVEDHKEAVKAVPEEAEAAMETQPRSLEVLVADVQKEVDLVMEMLINGILRKEPHSWSPLEQLLVSRRAAKL